jgi:phosphate butyryltransferase
MRSFDEVIEAALEKGTRRLAIAGAINDELSAALREADSRGLATARAYETTALAIDAVRSGEADVLMKGGVSSAAFLHAVFDHANGLRTNGLVSHVLMFEAFGRLMLLTDGGIVLNPTLDQKVGIIRNALPLAHRLGIETPRVAVLAASEEVRSAMPETMDAAVLARMSWEGCIVEGPLAMDIAVSSDAARAKGVGGLVAGCADVLLVPSVLVGNILGKGILHFSRCRAGGVVAGTSRPVTFLSRGDTAERKLDTIALGVLMAGETHE